MKNLNVKLSENFEVVVEGKRFPFTRDHENGHILSLIKGQIKSGLFPEKGDIIGYPTDLFYKDYRVTNRNYFEFKNVIPVFNNNLELEKVIISIRYMFLTL